MLFEWLLSDADSIEALDGAVRYIPAALALSGLALTHFVYSLYARCWKHGVLIDYWHYVVGLGVVLPFFAIYPFAAAAPNFIAVGSALTSIQEYLGEAFAITLIGYGAMLLGRRQVERTSLEQSWIYGKVYGQVIGSVAHVALRSNITLRLAELSALLGLFIVGYSQQQFGEVFGIRDRLFQDPVGRIIFNLWYSIYVVSFALSCMRLAHQRSWYVGVLLGLAFACASVTGSRMMTFVPAMDVLIAVMVVFRGRLKYRVLIPIIATLAAVIGLITSLRNAEQEDLISEADIAIPLVTTLYGNSLSDLRDFAWVLSEWEPRGDALYGKTYAAAAISFVPRSISEFREEYSVGTYTNELVGLDSAIHPGLRGGRFLEPYINFGWVGVIAIGYLAGCFLSTTAATMRAQSRDANGLARAYAATIPYFIFGQLMISAGFWVVYVFVLIILSARWLKPQLYV